MTHAEIIAETVSFVKDTLHGAEGGHDWFHIHRVFLNAQQIAKGEKADSLVIALGALLHDIADAKFHDGDEEKGPNMAHVFLSSLKVDQKVTDHVIQIIRHISFKNSLSKEGKTPFDSIELQIVQDADRLDAIGAIGIARAFNYGGFKNRELYNPDIAPVLHMAKETYKNSNAPTLNHFYEKLLLLKNRMNTSTGKKLAEERHAFMETYLEQFYREWNGDQ